MSVPSAPRQGAASKDRDPCPNKKCTPRLHLLGDAASWVLLLLLISLSLDLGFVHCYGEYQHPPHLFSRLFNSISPICI